MCPNNERRRFRIQFQRSLRRHPRNQRLQAFGHNPPSPSSERPVQARVSPPLQDRSILATNL